MASYWSLTNQRLVLLCVNQSEISIIICQSIGDQYCQINQSEVSIYLAVCAWEEACLDCSCYHNQRSYCHTPDHEEETEWCWELSVV